VLIPQASSPSWIEMPLIVTLFDIVEDITTNVIVITSTSWIKNAIDMLNLVESDRSLFLVDDWNNSGSLCFHIVNIGNHDVRLVVGELREFFLHGIGNSLGENSDGGLLIGIYMFLPVERIGIRNFFGKVGGQEKLVVGQSKV